MMRICPKCGDYYADGSLAFCLADGTPLVSVDPGSQNWSEGARIIAEKANALRKQKRRLKWRRVSSVTTMLVVTIIVYALAANRWVYLEPNNDVKVKADEKSKGNDNFNGNVNSNGNDNSKGTVNSNGNDNSKGNVNSKRNDNSKGNDNSRGDDNSKGNDNSRGDDKVCSDDQQKAETKIILKRIAEKWQWDSDAERRQAISRIAVGPGNKELRDPRGPQREDSKAKVGADPGKMDYTTTFYEKCTVASVTFHYLWNVWRTDPATGIYRLSVSNRKVFRCSKAGSTWSCEAQPGK